MKHEWSYLMRCAFTPLYVKSSNCVTWISYISCSRKRKRVESVRSHGRDERFLRARFEMEWNDNALHPFFHPPQVLRRAPPKFRIGTQKSLFQTHLTQRGDEGHTNTHQTAGCSICWHTCLAGLCFYVQRLVFVCSGCLCAVVRQCTVVLQLNLDRPSAGTIVRRRPDAGDSLTSERQKEKQCALIIKTSILVNCVNWCVSSGSKTYRAEYHHHNR